MGITAYAIMHNFAKPDRAGWDGFDDPLTPEQQVALIKARARPEPGPAVTVTPEDEPLLQALARDGRSSYAALAARIGRPEAQVARRIDALLASGAAYVDVDIAADALGFSTSARLYLSVAPAQLHAVGEMLARHRETAFVGAVTGPVNLVASVWCTDLDHLYRYVTTTLGVIPAIQAIETSLVLEPIKQAGSLMRGSLLATPIR